MHAVLPQPAGRRAAAACMLAVAASAALAAWWQATGRIRTTGDEPHYLIIAASALRDGDLDLRNNYEHDAETGEIYGVMRPHVWRTDGGWRSFHTPGLGLLLAAPFGLGGVFGARAALCLLVGVGLGWTVWRWLAGRLPPGDAAIATAGLLGCPPVLFGASRLYPDLPGGVVATAMLVWLLADRRRTRVGWTGFWLGAAALCWLHVKFVIPAAVLAVWAVRRLRPGRRLLAAAAALLGAAGGALAWLQVTTAGRLLGARQIAELSSGLGQAAEALAGLHLDQAQGMFFQQPLLLPGLAALGWMVRRRHPLTLPWLLLYLSLILPNALNGSRYGSEDPGGAPAGRFAWSAMWLWIVPLGIWIEAEGAAAARRVRPLAAAAAAYQAVLAIRWLPSPTALQPLVSYLVWERHSLFPVAARYALPSFYFGEPAVWLTYLPNVVWLAAAALLVATGWAWRAEKARGRLRAVWLTGLALAALLLPVEPAADRRREEALAGSVLGRLPRRFEAERMAPAAFTARAARRDPSASDGAARASSPAPPDGVVVFGPYVALEPGRYRVETALRLLEPASGGAAARFDVAASRGRTIVGAMDVPAARLRQDRWNRAAITFETPDALEDVEFRVHANPAAAILIDYVELTPVLPRRTVTAATVATEIREPDRKAIENREDWP